MIKKEIANTAQSLVAKNEWKKCEQENASKCLNYLDIGRENKELYRKLLKAIPQRTTKTALIKKAEKFNLAYFKKYGSNLI